MNLASDYLASVIRRLTQYKELGERTFQQLSDQDFSWKPGDQANSVAILIKHLSGNMLSRWTDFLGSDGEKPWRDRDGEFEEDQKSRAEILEEWEKGWRCLLEALNHLKEEDLEKTIRIRQEPLVVVDAINRQLAHIAYHIGQIVFIGKACAGNNWVSLSIPRGQSRQFKPETNPKKP